MSRILGGLCGLVSGFACGARVDDEFLTISFGVMGAFIGMNLGFVRSLVLGILVFLLLYLF
ncbi:hypothetical protein [Pseudodesulfovibrio senegalensis]|uniref:Uncharacterized protein n=1 Tax=Pseudodesulfovibrio senegalensis TaxID=1721087 RepID=A0A6N6N3F7_9BACT|nr:hypothetical protein [Pseudodesulfovibrio senegalensis]KAB1442780.1 hypothetical protein F8A88_00440 [Pseudodesulfovibrio senegalensis]